MLFKSFTEIESARQQQIKAILLNKLSLDNPLPGRSYDYYLQNFNRQVRYDGYCLQIFNQMVRYGGYCLQCNRKMLSPIITIVTILKFLFAEQPPI